MNKRIIAAASLALLLCLPVKAAATEEGCRIQAGEVKTLPGKMVDIPIIIQGNTGFTNFGIVLEYDADLLELQQIRIPMEEGDCLKGAYASVNTAWTTPEKKNVGYAAAASSRKITENGTLFVARFLVKAALPGNAEVAPHVYYLRCPDDTAAIGNVPVTAGSGAVNILQKGDVNLDGIVEYDDVVAAYKAAKQEQGLTGLAFEAADMDGSGAVEMADAEAIYSIYTGGK